MATKRVWHIGGYDDVPVTPEPEPTTTAGQFHEDHERDMADPEYAEAFREASAEVTTTAASDEWDGEPTHSLKVWPAFFDDLADGTKTFEVRRNDRGFAVWDYLLLQEWDPATERYTGREVWKCVRYVLAAEDCPAQGLTEGFVVLGVDDV